MVYAQYHFFNELADTALGAAIEAEIALRGGATVVGESGSKFVALLNSALDDAFAGDVMSVDSLHRLHASMPEAGAAALKTVDDLLAAFRGRLAKLETSFAAGQGEGLKAAIRDILDMHSYALSYLSEARSAEDPRMRRFAA